MTSEMKAKIDAMSREELARAYRFAPAGDPMWCGAAGDYATARFRELGGFSPAISKTLDRGAT